MDEINMCAFSNQGGYKAPIARWRIDSNDEHILAERADRSESWKEKYVEYYRMNDAEYYERGLTMIDRTIAVFVKEELTASEREMLVTDMIYSLHRFGCAFDEYFLYGYQYLNARGRELFITDKVRYELYSRMNFEENHRLFVNKWCAYQYFSDYYKRKLIALESDADYQKFVDFYGKVDRFIVKPLEGQAGRNVKVYQCDKAQSLQELFGVLIQNGPVVVEEVIKQSDAIGRIHPSSINTVRMVTVKCKDRTHIFHPFFRMGMNGAVVDNAGSGGILANVDPETGILYTPGYDEKGNKYLLHPNSKIAIVGFQIPHWEDAVRLAGELAQKTTNRYVGWDLALTDKGWIVVEGNDCGQFVMQIADKKGLLNELQRLIEDM